MGAEICEKTKRNFVGSVRKMTFHMDQFLFYGPVYAPPSIASPAINILVRAGRLAK